ncbi:hypothetical protein PJ900_21610 [Tistrella mobilis]
MRASTPARSRAYIERHRCPDDIVAGAETGVVHVAGDDGDRAAVQPGADAVCHRRQVEDGDVELRVPVGQAAGQHLGPGPQIEQAARRRPFGQAGEQVERGIGARRPVEGPEAVGRAVPEAGRRHVGRGDGIRTSEQAGDVAMAEPRQGEQQIAHRPRTIGPEQWCCFGGEAIAAMGLVEQAHRGEAVEHTAEPGGIEAEGICEIGGGCRRAEPVEKAEIERTGEQLPAQRRLDQIEQPAGEAIAAGGLDDGKRAIAHHQLAFT